MGENRLISDSPLKIGLKNHLTDLILRISPFSLRKIESGLFPPRLWLCVTKMRRDGCLVGEWERAGDLLAGSLVSMHATPRLGSTVAVHFNQIFSEIIQ